MVSARSVSRTGVCVAAGLAMASAFAAPASAWSRSYVVSWYEPAFYYQPDDPAATSGEANGKDCANGFSPYPDYPNLLRTKYRSQKQVDYFLDPARRGEPGFDRRTYGIRGPNGEDVYKEPWTVPDVPYPHPTAGIAYGFNLDGDERTGFTSPEGVKGVDNAFYMVGGCVGYWRGPARGSDGFKYSNEDMHNGDFTILITLEGEGAQMKDGKARLLFRKSQDRLVRDAVGGIAGDYSFRIEGKPEYESAIDVVIRNGAIESAGPQTIVLKDWKHNVPLTLTSGQLRFKVSSDGQLEGMIGGYRYWEDHYKGFARAIPEYIMKLNVPAYWRSLQREADGMKDPKTGKFTGVSSVYRLWAVPAFAIPGDKVVTARLTRAPLK
jgi:hypothetical protein